MNLASFEEFLQLLPSHISEAIVKDNQLPRDTTFVCPNSKGPWSDAVLEARDHGISIRAFGNTRNKTVIHPGYMGVPFNYYWGKGSWSSESCFDDEVCYEERVNANTRLYSLAQLITEGSEEKKCSIRVRFVKILGSGKGHLSNILLRVNLGVDFQTFIEQSAVDMDDDYVIFVYHADVFGDYELEDDSE